MFTQHLDSLTTFLNKWYKEPDVEGIFICLCVYQAHHWLQDPSIFLQVIGLPGSGKTELGIGAIKHLAVPKFGFCESEITQNSFISGFGEDIGLLPRLPGCKKEGSNYKSNGVVLFPDFSTIASKDIKEIKVINAALRRIYDGDFEKRVGNQGKQYTWSGKVSCIAACTPDIEDFWMLHRDMGERWLTIHWKTVVNTIEEQIGYAEKASEQIGNKPEIRKGFHQHISALMKTTSNLVNVDPQAFKITNSQAVLLEILRTPIKRENTGRGYMVMGKGNTQMATRTPQNLISIARASASIRNKKEIDDEDIKLTKRICLESIPSRRTLILKALLDYLPNSISKRDLANLLAFSRTTLDRAIEDLRYLDVICIQPIASDESDLFTIDDSATYAANSLYAFKNPKADSLISLSPSILKLIRSSHLL